MDINVTRLCGSKGSQEIFTVLLASNVWLNRGPGFGSKKDR